MTTHPRPDLRHQPRGHDAHGYVGVFVIERRPVEQRGNREHGRAEGGDLDQVSHMRSVSDG